MQENPVLNNVTNVVNNRVHTAMLLEKKEIAAETFEFTFKTAEKLSFKPGQYAWLQVINLKYPDPRGERRAFSFINAPDGSDTASFIFRESASGFKKTLLDLKVGGQVNIIAPFGFSFVLPDDLTGPLVMLGAGTGISPFLSILRFAKLKKSAYPLYLIYYEKSANRIIYNKDLQEISTFVPNARASIVNQGFTWDQIANIQNIKQATFFVSGPQDFINEVNKVLLDSGINLEKQKFEAFYPQTENDKNIQSLIDAVLEKKTDSNLPEQKQIVLLKSLIESSTNHIVVTNLAGEILFANKAAEIMTGFTLREMKGNTPRLWGGLMSKEFYENLWAKKRSGESINEELVNRRKNGDIYYVMSHISPIKQENGNITGFIGTEEDITELKNRELNIKNKSAELNTFFSTNLDLMCIANTNGYFEKVNNTFVTLLGYNEEHLLKTPFLDLTHPDDKISTTKEIEKLAKGTSTINFINRYLAKDGKYLWLQWNATPIGNKIYATARDITKAKEDEIKGSIQAERMQELTKRFIFATESAKIGIWEWDVINDKLTWDDQMYKLYGIKPEDFGGAYEAWQAGLHPDDKKSADEAIQAALVGEKNFDTLFRVIWPDKSIHHIKAYGTVDRDDKGVPQRMVGMNWDVTKDIELDNLKDEFLSMASHELRTPLTAIDGLVSMIRDGEYGPVNENLIQPLTDINTSSERLIHLVNDLLNVSRLRAGRLKYTLSEFSIKQPIDETVNLLSVVAKEKGLFLKSENIQDVKVQGDLDKVKEILNNLIGNSIKFTDRGGITVITERKGNLLTLFIKDTGIGIKEEDKRKLFGTFQQLDSGKGRPPGSGLGLHISREIARKLGGDLILDSSEPNKGTVFAFSIPISGSNEARNVLELVNKETESHPDQKSN